MKTIFQIILLCTISATTMAQPAPEIYTKWRSPDGRNIDLLYKNSNSQGEVLPEIKTIGSPYENENFEPSVILFNDGTAISDFYIRYNAYENQMEFKDSISAHDSLIKIVKKSPDFTIKIADKYYDFVPYSGAIDKGVYFEILFRGNKVDLYKKTSKIYTEAKIARTSFEVDFPRRFKDQFDYYFVNPQGHLVEIKGTEKKKIEALGLKKKELNQYVKENKINLNEESDLIKLMSYLDSLI